MENAANRLSKFPGWKEPIPELLLDGPNQDQQVFEGLDDVTPVNSALVWALELNVERGYVDACKSSLHYRNLAFINKRKKQIRNLFEEPKEFPL
jgi:hypothetical protein